MLEGTRTPARDPTKKFLEHVTGWYATLIGQRVVNALEGFLLCGVVWTHDFQALFIREPSDLANFSGLLNVERIETRAHCRVVYPGHVIDVTIVFAVGAPKSLDICFVGYYGEFIRVIAGLLAKLADGTLLVAFVHVFATFGKAKLLLRPRARCFFE